MPRFNVNPKKEAELLRRMEALGVRETDLDERFVKAGGSGGQKLNKTSSCVVIEHKPTGIRVRCDRERSQSINRFIARRELCDKIEAQTPEGKERAATEAERAKKKKADRARKSRKKHAPRG